MAITQVQQTPINNTASANPATVTFPANTTAGNLLTLQSCEYDNVAISSVTGGGTWVFDGTTATSGSNIGLLEQWHCLSATGGATTVSITYASAPSSGRESIQAWEWSGGPWYAGAFAAVSNVASSTTIYSPSITPASAGALVISICMTKQVLTVPPNTSGWTDYTNVDAYSFWNNSYQVGDAAYIVDATTAAEQVNWTVGTTSSYSSTIATFLTSPASAAYTPKLIIASKPAMFRAGSY